MKRFSDDDLILFRYGESPEPEAVRDALAADPQLAARYAELERALAAVDLADVPEAPPGFETELWARLRPELTPRRRSPVRVWAGSLRALPALWPVAAAFVLVAGGFLAGRWARETPAAVSAAAVPAPSALSPEARDRVLFASVASHLDSSERLLVDLVNRTDESATLPDERAFAEALLESNRLYRRAAERAGERRIVDLLDRLEPVLLELVHSPAEGEVRDLRRQVETGDLLFRVRIVGANLESRPPARPAPSTPQL
jgi:hypothetical protein